MMDRRFGYADVCIGAAVIEEGSDSSAEPCLRRRPRWAPGRPSPTASPGSKMGSLAAPKELAADRCGRRSQRRCGRRAYHRRRCRSGRFLLGVTIGGGPGSATRESKWPGRTGSTGVLVASVQCNRSVGGRPGRLDLCCRQLVPRKYIQYLPSIFSGTMAPDFVHFTFQLPL